MPELNLNQIIDRLNAEFTATPGSWSVDVTTTAALHGKNTVLAKL